VLIAARLRSEILQEVTQTSTEQSWKWALEILRKYQSYSSSAKRCVVALELLYERVISSTAAEPPADQTDSPACNEMRGTSPYEGIDIGMLDGLDLMDWQDMSWLNSVPSNLY